MFEMVFYPALFIGVLVAALIAYIAVIGAVQVNRHRDTGWLHYCFYGIFLTVAVNTLTSGRDFSQKDWLLALVDAEGRSPIAAWVSRVISLFLILASAERIAHAILVRKKASAVTVLLPAFILYWVCAVASPGLLGRYPQFSYEYIYPLLIGWAALLFSEKECELSIVAARNATFLFLLGSVLMVPIKMSLVLETNYSQGFIPGLPRLAGLSPHALQLGLVAQIGLLCLWVCPLKSKWLNRASWALGLLVLFLAQSKTAWISFALCAVVMTMVRSGVSVKKMVFNPMRPTIGVVIVLAGMASTLLVAYVLVFGHLGDKVFSFLDTKEGATLLTLNGRDQIWAVAFQEWHNNPIFGYGPNLFSLAHRTSVGLLNATHSHNQFVDDLARAGLVGAVALVCYTSVLAVYAFRYARVTGGLSLCLFLVLAIRGISEVPFTLYGYASEFAAQLLMLIVLLGAFRHVSSANKKVLCAAPAHYAVKAAST